MFLKFLEKLTDKIDMKIIINVIYFFCLFLLLLPLNIIKELNLFDFKQKYISIIGAIVLLITSYYVTEIIIFIYKKAKKHITIKKELSYKKELFSTLSNEEKDYLNRFYNSKMKRLENSASFEVNDGTVVLLERKGIIVRGSNISLGGTNFSYILQPWAYEAFTKELKERK